MQRPDDFEEEKVRLSLKIEAAAPFSSKGSKNEASGSAKLNAKCEESCNAMIFTGVPESKVAIDGNKAEEQCATKNSPSTHSSPSRRGKRDPPQPSPNGRDPHHFLPKNDPSKRLHFALQTLEAPAHSMNNMSMSRSPRRRNKRDRSPPKASQESTSLLSWQSGGEESPQIETQYTVGTILANADIGGMSFNKRHRSGDSSDVPLSQANDAEDNGESQVVWFAAQG
mmetsp:Transcript_30251/g.64106  ORF Transcript_30251/g.64106 Transcript_30251/m.64106 type:complete len:226 (+) Transcript_30251:1040-1717(+)